MSDPSQRKTPLEELAALLAGMDKSELDSLAADTAAGTADMPWVPVPGPQTVAYFSEADEVFYGGAAGGGKTALLLGLSLTAHHRSLILRRTNKEASKLVEDYVQILGHRDGWNGQQSVWHYKDKIIDVGGCQFEEDKQKYKGIAHDFIGFDEVSDFAESQYTFITTWNRSAKPGQRCRIMAAGNPPTRPEGFWVVKRWAPWLDPKHPNPALPGELRWFTSVDGNDVEVDGPGPHMIDGFPVRATSRTFIPAKLADNPYLASTDYRARLQAIQNPVMRAAYLEGRFDVVLEDDVDQVIPLAWIRQAQERWKPQPPVGVPMCALGVDVAQGGRDHTVLCRRYDLWFAPLIAIPGKKTPTGAEVAAAVLTHRRDRCQVVIDVGGGWGGEALAALREQGVDAVGYMGVNPAQGRSADRFHTFCNKRTMAYWRLREALNPDQPGGSRVCLPDDPELVADLCAQRFETRPGGVVALEAKEKVRERIGRSTDKADALVMALTAGQSMAVDGRAWRLPGPGAGFGAEHGSDERMTNRLQSHANMGYANRRR